MIDRGATDVPEHGAPYLGKEGIPYRLVDTVHAVHCRAARELGVAEAAVTLLGRHLRGAVFASRAKLAKLFELCMSGAELDRALASLAGAREIDVVRVDGKELIIRRG